jgi:hypothetical protein
MWREMQSPEFRVRFTKDLTLLAKVVQDRGGSGDFTDTFVPIESSRSAVHQFTTEHKLVEIEGAQHGFAVHDDPTYANPQSQKWQKFVICTVLEWVTTDS